MLHFERSTDYELIRRILVHEKVYRHITDDNSPPAEDYYPPEGEQIWYIVVRDIYPDSGPQEVLGLYVLIPQNSICWDMHIAMLPPAWGERAHTAFRMFFDWIWEHTPCERIVMSVPSSNRLALHYAVNGGMHIYGTNHLSFLKNGILRDQVCFGRSRSDRREDGLATREAVARLKATIEGGIECLGQR